MAGVLSDTAQTTCFLYGAVATCPDPGSYLYGQDAQFGWDLLVTPAERFARTLPVADEPVVFDHITQLVWQGCPAGLEGEACLPPAFGDAMTATHDDAIDYCQSLVYGGFSDWRLPTFLELSTTVNATVTNPSTWSTWFPSVTGDDEFWSSTIIGYWGYSRAAVTFWDGDLVSEPPSEELQIRCVRSDSPGLVPGFHRDTTSFYAPVVRDAATGLTWQGCNAGAAGDNCENSAAWYMDWNSAVTYCDNLDLAGYTDWRLPDRMELLSILDLRQSSPGIDPTAFPGTAIAEYWTSTSVSANYAWSLDFNFGWFWDSYKFDDTRATVRCVRDGFDP